MTFETFQKHQLEKSGYVYDFCLGLLLEKICTYVLYMTCTYLLYMYFNRRQNLNSALHVTIRLSCLLPIN